MAATQRRVTLDELIAELKKQKEAGLPGSTVMALAGLGNNGGQGFANFNVAPHVSAVAKTEFDKGWAIAKFVSRGGVPVLVLGG